MLAAACAIGVTPLQFWRLSLNEWRAIAAPRSGLAALQRAEFEALARRFPD
jgi:uncharacterized phage protein (TIGR02216 family)